MITISVPSLFQFLAYKSLKCCTIGRNERVTINRMIGENRAIRSASTANCFNVDRFAINSRSTSTSDVPFSAPLKHVTRTRVRKRERPSTERRSQIAFAIETSTAKAIDRARKRINRESMTSWNSYPAAVPPRFFLLGSDSLTETPRITWRCDPVYLQTRPGESRANKPEPFAVIARDRSAPLIRR